MFSNTFTLSGLTCPACKILSEKRLVKIPDVKSATVDLSSGKTVIEATRQISITEIKTALKGTPYEPQI